MNQMKVEENSAPDATLPVNKENVGKVTWFPVPLQVLPGRTENLPPTYLSSTPRPYPQCYGEPMNMVLNTDMTPLPENPGNLTASSSLPQEVAEAVPHKSVDLVEAGRRRAHRLIRNRDASRECRRKKKEYIKCLEDRLDMLENRNRTLIDELKALKDIK